MIKDVAGYRTNHLVKQRSFVRNILRQIGSRKPRMVVFYDEHAPFEPTQGIVEILARKFSRDDIEFLKVPEDHTPLGQALEACDFLEKKAEDFLSRKLCLDGFSYEESIDFGRQLLWIMEMVRKRSKELLAIYDQGFQEGNGIGGGKVRGILEEAIRREFGDSLPQFEKMLERIRLEQNYPPCLELVCHELSTFHPQAYFATLHFHWPGQLIYQMALPDKFVWSTWFARKVNILAEQYLNSKLERGKSGWCVTNHKFASDLLELLLPFQDFDQKVRFSVFEMPHFLLSSLPPLESVFVRAVSGAFLLPDPFGKAGEKKFSDWDMDYFRSTQVDDQEIEEHAANLGDFFNHALASGVLDKEL